MTDHKLEHLLAQVSEPDPVDGHLDPIILADYADQLLAEDDMELVRDHLALCNACTDALLALDDDLGFDLQPSNPPVRAESWADIVAAAGDKQDDQHAAFGAADHAHQPVAPPTKQQPSAAFFPWVAAAACLAFAGWAWFSRSSPVAITTQEYVDLSQATSAVRGEDAVFPGTAGKNLSFVITPQSDLAPDQWVLKRTEQARVISRGPASQTSTGLLMITVSGSQLAPGEYQLDLFNTSDPNTSLATYRFVLSD